MCIARANHVILFLQVHCDWLDAICSGRAPPKVVHELLPEEADLYLQDSCHLQLPPSWRLVSVCIIGQNSQEDGDRYV